LDKCPQGLRVEGFLNYIFCGHKSPSNPKELMEAFL